MLKHNYHTHTVLCNHSSLTIEDQVLLAIQNKLKTIGFSEHIDLPSGDDGLRLANFVAFKKFVKGALLMKEKYKNQIDVRIGLESEIIDPQTGLLLFDHIKKRLSYPGVEYFIIGHHFYRDGVYSKTRLNTMKESKFYVNAYKKALKELKPLYLAHPDVFLNTRGDAEWQPQEKYIAKHILKLSKKHNIILGINLSGLRHKENYPNMRFFEMAKDEGCVAIIELDAHSTNDWSAEYIKKTYAFAKKTKIKLVDKIDF
ncbi:PHP domain-containing protein [Candidatus Mycoplasma mahonii]|uniref:PHP domain-containing protein n=1 Tax=Candidatus Mycoplasma mahonii TaxID=3004105 RepID=UPI0026F182F7|nr:PHP domain-containing protein [Candidatus Mycoplasma mahonii]WKX02750.1 PHP domain-containing protein [Candidatus Mycoplasma mahonii]